MDDIETKTLDYYDAMAKFKKAVFQSHGLCNNENGWKIALRAESTVDDVVRLGSYAKVPSPSNKKIGGAARTGTGKGKSAWYYRVEARKYVPFKDTCVYRYIVEHGGRRMLDRHCIYEDTDHKRVYGHKAFYGGSRHDSKLMNIIAFCKICPEGLKNYENIQDTIASIKFEPAYYSAYASKEKKAEFSKGVRESIKMELNMLANLPKEVLVFAEAAGYRSITKAVWNTYGATGNTTVLLEDETINKVNKGDVAREKALQMMRDLEYMGIGVVGEGANGLTGRSLGKGMSGLMKCVSTNKNKFIRMVKQGFDVGMVREEIASILAAWTRVNCHEPWSFYARTDAKDKYEDIEVKVKKLGRSGSARPSIVELDDSEAVEVEVNGQKFKFNKTEAK